MGKAPEVVDFRGLVLGQGLAGDAVVVGIQSVDIAASLVDAKLETRLRCRVGTKVAAVVAVGGTIAAL